MNHIYSIFRINLIDISELINIYNLNFKGINQMTNNDYCDNIFTNLTISNLFNMLTCISIYYIILYMYILYILIYIPLVFTYLLLLIRAFVDYFMDTINFIDYNIIIYI